MRRVRDGVDRRPHPRVIGGDEPDDRHHEVGGVERVTTERLRERAGCLVPALGHDRIGDFVPAHFPPVDAGAGVETVGQRDGTVQRNPAHELAVQEVAARAPDLPDAVVLFLPPFRGEVGQVSEEPARDVVDAVQLLRQSMDRVEQLAVHVELSLVPGAVADPYRRAALPAGEVGELALAQVVFAPDAVHDLQVGTLAHL